ncbi:MAG: multidrug efflux SMR transporter [Rubrobacter sp.]|nr:multidrug efflux SMR transporter [Rubrobacter sp.]
MAWIIVLVAGLFEIVMALSLEKSHGFSRLLPSIGFLVFGGLSFYLLALALRDLPVGTAYAVWTGTGAVGTAILGILILGESANVWRLGAILLIVAGIVALRLAPGS